MVVFGNRGSLLWLVLSTAACSGQSVTHVREDAIIGDWLLCSTSSCTAIDDDGMRLREDHIVQQLDTREGPIAPPVCVVVTQTTRPYEFDGEYISMDGQRVELQLNEDRLTLIDLPVISSGAPAPMLQDVHFVRVPTFESATCP
jgi:hypothetical protein